MHLQNNNLHWWKKGKYEQLLLEKNLQTFIMQSKGTIDEEIWEKNVIIMKEKQYTHNTK